MQQIVIEQPDFASNTDQATEPSVVHILNKDSKPTQPT